MWNPIRRKKQQQPQQQQQEALDQARRVRADDEEESHDSRVLKALYSWVMVLLGVSALLSAVSRPVANLGSFRWQPHCRALYQTPMAA
jgi:hypothetical protein